MTVHPAPISRFLHHDSFGFILLLGLVTGIQGIGTTLTLPALPAIAAGFATTPEMAQLTISGFLIGTACGQLLSGALSDRFGRRPILLGGIALSVVAGLGCTLSPNIESLIALRVLQGFGGAAGMILGRAIVRDLFEHERAVKAMSTIAGILSLVPMAGPPLTGVLLQWLSWRAIYGIVTLISLVLGIMTWMWIAESLAKPDPAATNPRRILLNCLEMLRRPECMGFVLTGCLTYGGIFAFMALIAFITRDSFGFDVSAGGWMVGAMSLAGWLGAHINGRLTGRWPVLRSLRVSTGLSAIGGLAMLAATVAMTTSGLAGPAALVAILAAMLAFGISFGITHPTTIVVYLRPLPHIAGTAAALAASFQTLSGALFAWLAAALYDGTPLALGYCMTLSGVSVLLVFTFIAAPHARR